MKKQQVMLSLGANLPSSAGLPRATLESAIGDIAECMGDILAVSSFYRSKAVTLEENRDGIPDFVNACILLGSSLSPPDLLQTCKALERCYGRQSSARWSVRPLDIDLIGCGDLVLPDAGTWWRLAQSPDPAAFLEKPVVPHPRAHVRAFVLLPLRDIAPNWVHPLLGRTVADLCADPKLRDDLAATEKITADE